MIRPVVLALLLPLALAAAPGAPAEEPASRNGPAPMTNEDVVVLFVRGVSEEEIVRRIGERAPAFDLSDEMVRELRVAGLPDDVLRAMRARTSAFAPEPSAATDGDGPAPEVGPSLRVALEGAVDGVFELSMPAAVPDGLARSMELPADPEARRIHAVALFALCLEATHVPDRWRDRSPLGRDFLFAPRHRLLGFEAGAPVRPEGVPESPDPGVRIAHRVPAALDVPLAGEDHVVLVGLALSIGDRWRVYRTADLGPVTLPPEGRDVAVRVRAPKSASLEQELEIVDGPGGGS